MREKWDILGNITIISDEANNFLRFKDPKQYLTDLNAKSPELLEKHFVPKDPTLWKIDNYEQFVKQRAILIAKAIENEFNIKVHFDISPKNAQ